MKSNKRLLVKLLCRLLSVVWVLISISPVRAQNVIATVPVGPNPVAVAVNPLTNKIYVAGGSVVTVIDGETNRTATVAVGRAPIAIAVNQVTNKIYVANRGNILANIRGSVTEIDGATNSTTTIRDPNATFPSAIAVNFVTDKIYVTNYSHNVTVIDGRTRSTTTVTDRNAAFPVAVAVNPVTNKIYVANANSANVTVIDGATNSTTTVPVTLPNVLGPVALAVDSVTDKIYVANNGIIRNSNNAGDVTVIDGPTNTTITIHDPHAIAPVALAVNSITNKIYVVNRGYAGGAVMPGNITVIDGHTNLTTTVADPHGVAPQDVAVNSLANKIYVTNDGNSVTVINGRTNSFVDITDPHAQSSVGAPLAVDAVTDRIYVANWFSNNVTVIHDPYNASLPITVSLSPSSVKVTERSTQVFKATVANDSRNLGVTWRLASPCDFGPACRGGLTVTSPFSATYVAPSTTAGNPITITATSNADPTKMAKASVTIVPPQ